MEFLLNRGGLRVVFGKTQGLFNKNTRPNQYAWIPSVGSRSDGPDPTHLRSNLDHPLRIGRLACIAREGAALDRRTPIPVAALRRSWPNSVLRVSIQAGLGPGRTRGT
jgi:hypothetical protein